MVLNIFNMGVFGKKRHNSLFGHTFQALFGILPNQLCRTEHHLPTPRVPCGAGGLSGVQRRGASAARLHAQIVLRTGRYRGRRCSRWDGKGLSTGLGRARNERRGGVVKICVWCRGGPKHFGHGALNEGALK